MTCKKIIGALVIAVVCGACAQSVICPQGTYWDAVNKTCMPIKSQHECPDAAMVDLEQAVTMAIACVKDDPGKFDKVFADLISIAQANPNLENGERIYRFVEAVAVKAPYVPEKKAKAKWNRFFSPVLFVSFGYNYDTIANSVCSRKDEVKREIDAELSDKKTGLLGCMADQQNKGEAQEYYLDAQRNAQSLKRTIDAACRACCERKR